MTEIKYSVGSLTSNLKDTEKKLKDEFVTNRKEAAQGSKDLREEVSNQLNAFTKTFPDQLTVLTKTIEDKFTSFQTTLENEFENVFRAYQELEDFATINFKPFVPITNSPARGLLLHLGMLE